MRKEIRENFCGGGIEPMKRKSKDPIDEALSFERLMAEGKSQKQIALETNHDQSYVSITLKLLKLPIELRDLVTVGALKTSLAIVLVRRCTSHEEMLDVMRKLGVFTAGSATVTTSSLEQHLNCRDQMESHKSFITSVEGECVTDESSESVKPSRHKRSPNERFMYDLLASAGHLAVLLERLVQSQENADKDADFWMSVSRSEQKKILEFLRAISHRSHVVTLFLQRRALLANSNEQGKRISHDFI